MVTLPKEIIEKCLEDLHKIGNLNHDNHKKWFINVEDYLVLNNLWDCIETDEQEKNQSSDGKKVLAILRGLVDETKRNELAKYNNPRSAWNYLKSYYESKIDSQDIECLNKIDNFKLAQDKNLLINFEQFNHLFTKLKKINTIEDYKLAKFCSKLNENRLVQNLQSAASEEQYRNILAKYDNQSNNQRKNTNQCNQMRNYERDDSQSIGDFSRTTNNQRADVSSTTNRNRRDSDQQSRRDNGQRNRRDNNQQNRRDNGQQSRRDNGQQNRRDNGQQNRRDSDQQTRRGSSQNKNETNNSNKSKNEKQNQNRRNNDNNQSVRSFTGGMNSNQGKSSNEESNNQRNQINYEKRDLEPTSSKRSPTDWLSAEDEDENQNTIPTKSKHSPTDWLSTEDEAEDQNTIPKNYLENDLINEFLNEVQKDCNVKRKEADYHQKTVPVTSKRLFPDFDENDLINDFLKRNDEKDCDEKNKATNYDRNSNSCKSNDDTRSQHSNSQKDQKVDYDDRYKNSHS